LARLERAFLFVFKTCARPPPSLRLKPTGGIRGPWGSVRTAQFAAQTYRQPVRFALQFGGDPRPALGVARSTGRRSRSAFDVAGSRLPVELFRVGSPGYRVKFRSFRAKIRDFRAAAPWRASGCMGHVFDK